MAVIWSAVVTRAARRGRNSQEWWLGGSRGCPRPVLPVEWQRWCHFTPSKLFSVASPRLAHVARGRVGSPRFGRLGGGLGLWGAQIWLAGGGWRCPRGLAAPQLPSPHSPSQLCRISKQPDLHPFMNPWRQHASVLLCSRLQDCVGGISFYFATLPFFFFFFAFHLFKARKWSIT